jgi:hypothetical protein
MCLCIYRARARKSRLPNRNERERNPRLGQERLSRRYNTKKTRDTPSNKRTFLKEEEEEEEEEE